jgi:hypothetical protein
MRVKLVTNIFYDNTNSCLDQFVPNKLPAVSKRSNYIHYPYIHYPYNVPKFIRKKTTAWQVHRTVKTNEFQELHKSAACECKSAVLDFVTSYENNLTTDGNLGDNRSNSGKNCIFHY